MFPIVRFLELRLSDRPGQPFLHTASGESAHVDFAAWPVPPRSWRLFFDGQLRIQAEANRKRSESQKGVPKAEAKERATTKCCNTSDHRKGQQAKAAASKTSLVDVARGDKLAKGGQPHQKKPTGSKSEPVEKTLSERRLGELLKEMPKAKGTSGKGSAAKRRFRFETA